MFLQVAKLYLCVFFCNYSQKNKIGTCLKVTRFWYVHRVGVLVGESTKWYVESLQNAVVMNRLTDQIQGFFESYAFGVCTRLGEKLGVATSSIRLFFIYASFITFGSPIIVYLSLAFIMNMRKHLRKRNPIWDY